MGCGTTSEKNKERQSDQKNGNLEEDKKNKDKDNKNVKAKDKNGEAGAEQVEKGKENEPERVVEIERALKNESYYPLGVLSQYLKDRGIDNKIVRRKRPNKLDDSDKKYVRRILQVIINSFSEEKRIDLTFNFGPEINKKISGLESDEQKKFIGKLEECLSKFFSLSSDDILLTVPKITEEDDPEWFLISVTFKNETELIKNIENKEKINEKNLKKALKQMNASKPVGIQSNFLLETIKLNLALTNSEGNVLNEDYPKEEEKRGRKTYYPPRGWKAYGLNVGKIYQDDGEEDDWIGFCKGDEWCIAYNGCSNKPEYKDLKDDFEAFNDKKKVGEGAYITPLPSILEKEARTITLQGKKYLIGFQVRANPNKLRVSKKNENYWITERNDSEIRPYRLLLKEIK